jgi:2-keto-4-pentenoate hydratase
MSDIESLINYIDRNGADRDAGADILLQVPELDCDTALKVQIGVKRRHEAQGDRIVGHQASFTSAGAQKLVPSMPPPMVGTLLASLMRTDGDVVSFDGDDPMYIEAEIGVLLKRDLAGPGVTPLQALAAVEAFFPAIEVAPLRPGVLEGKFSNQHLIAVQKASGGYVFTGTRFTSPRNFDARLEGVVVSIGGKPRASAAGVEAMGNPLEVIAQVANRLAAAGESLKAGQVLITGSLPPPQRMNANDAVASAEFTRLGGVTVRVAQKGAST